PQAPSVDHGRRDAQRAELAGAMVRVAATPPRAHSPRRPPAPAAPRPMVHSAQVCHPYAGSNGNSAPKPDASVATSTSARLPLHCARRVRPTPRIGAVSPHNLASLEPSAGFEARQAARFVLILPPLFWRHVSARFFAYHTQKGAGPHRQRDVA